MTNKHHQLPSNAFKFFDDKKFGKAPKVFLKIGTVAFSIFLIAIVIFDSLRAYGTQFSEGNIYFDLANLIMSAGFIFGVVSFAVAAVYYLGSHAGHNTFFSALAYTLKKVALYIFLPTFLIAILILLVIAIFYFVNAAR